MATKVFNGANVFMSRNLVPPELFDALHDALKLNGAQVFPCCDPSRNGPNDYHVIASSEHEKFDNLRSKGCTLIGPQCVLSCANEHRVLPNQGFTCCLAMHGVNILASGFEKDEKVDIAKMITSMGGVLHTKTSSDVDFVIAKNVLAKKYKWALNNLKKPIVTTNWLLQCWKEHRVVPQEPYKVLPFSGLTVCVSGIASDERKEMEKLVMQNGGIYSAELTRRCSHLVCDAPEGDKYKVAKRWGHIYIVNRKWFLQSVARRACLSEESYPVQATIASSMSSHNHKTLEQHTQGKVIRNLQYSSSFMATASDSETNFSAQDTETEPEIPLPNVFPTFFGAPPLPKEDGDPPADEHKHDIANDSQSEDDDLYLSDCRILFVGFEASDLRKLVGMVRQGGGSRYMSFNQKLTHVVVGNPSEIEIKEVRSLAALGVIYIVKTTWLEECTSKKKEVPVLQSHIAYDVLLPKDPITSYKSTSTSMTGSKQGNFSISQTVEEHLVEKKSQFDVSFGLNEEVKLKTHEGVNNGVKLKMPSGVSNGVKLKTHSGVSNGVKHIKSSTVFKGKLFRFSSSFPQEQRPEIVQWINEGGGEFVVDQSVKNVHFIVERHGAMSCQTGTSTVKSAYVTTHWVHSCLEDGYLLDVSSHILYSPLPCQIPLPGFEGYRVCVSRYEMKERQLLRNLCYVLGMKFIEKLTKKVTHLLCKFADGDKYEAACRWGIPVVTADWMYECATQNKVVDLERFHPKELTSQDRKEGLYSVSQYPTHAMMTSGASQHLSPLREMRNMQVFSSTGCMDRDEHNYSSSDSKRPRVSGNDSLKCTQSYGSIAVKSPSLNNPTENNVTGSLGEVSVVPDVAAAIEDLLEQTSKIQDLKSQESSSRHENFLFSNSTMLSQRHSDQESIPGPSQHWLNRIEKRDNIPSPGNAAAPKNHYDGFSETQTDSQVVGYEEDLTGRQMIIDRVRTRGSMP